MAHSSNCERYLIKGGTLVTENGLTPADLVIENGIITGKLEPGELSGTPDGFEVVDATDSLILPGGIDPHVHFDFTFNGRTTKHTAKSGGIAALLAGTTTVYDFVMDEEGLFEPEQLVAERSKLLADSPLTIKLHYCFVHEHTRVPEYVGRLRSLGIQVAVFGFYYAWKPASLTAIMPRLREEGLWLGLHAMEDADEPLSACYEGDLLHLKEKRHVIEQTEQMLFRRYGEVASRHGVPFYAMHVSSPDMLDTVWPTPYMYEVNAHHLFFHLDDQLTRADGQLLMCGPVLQTGEEQKKLLTHLARIHVVASDDAAFDKNDKGFKAKVQDVIKGIPGVGYRLPLLYTYGIRTGLLDWQQFLDVWCVRSAKAFGLYPAKATLQTGADADIVIMKPKEFRRTENPADKHLGWQPFAESLDGWPREVFVNGKRMVRNGHYVGK